MANNLIEVDVDMLKQLFQALAENEYSYVEAIKRSMSLENEFYNAYDARRTFSEILKNILFATFIDGQGEVTAATILKTIESFQQQKITYNDVFTC
jgi:hypothetical protein